MKSMASETSDHEGTRMDNPSELSKKNFYGKHMINPIINNNLQLTTEKLSKYLVKRTKAQKLEFTRNSLETNGQILKLWTSVFRSSKTVRDLVSDYSSCGEKAIQAIIQTLNHSLRGKMSIKRIKLDFAYCNGLNEATMEKLRRGLRSLVSLERMNLIFEHCLDFTDKEVQKLGHMLKALSHLQDISLDFRSNQITDKGVGNLGRNLKRLGDLKYVDLDLEGSKEVIGTGVQTFGQNLKTLKQLQTVHIDLNMSSHITDAGMSSIGQGLTYLEGLTDLKLHFSYCNFSDEGMLGFARGLEKLVFLKNLDLKFQSFFNVTDTGLLSLGLGLAKLNSLESLCFNFDTCTEIVNLRLFESQGLASLRSLKLGFSECENLSNGGLQDIGFGLKRLDSLQNLTLVLFECEKITGTGIQESFGEGLKSLINLKSLELSFRRCRGFTDFGLRVVGEGLKTLCSLKNLDIDFRNCDGVTERGVQDLGEGIKALCSLKNLYIIFNDCHLSEIEMQALVEGWTQLPLETVRLEFYGTFLSDEIVFVIGRCLSRVASLRSVLLDIGLLVNVTEAGKERFCEALKGHPCFENIELNSYDP